MSERLPAALAAPAAWIGEHAETGLIVLGLCLVAWVGWRLTRRRATPFRVVRRPLLTDNEREFLARLEAAFPAHRILAQVSMGALMTPDVPGGSPEFLSIRARYAQKVVDFVLLDDACEVVALVELDDRTHVTERDAVRDAMTASAGYVTLRYQSRQKPSPQALRDELARLHAALRR